MAIARLTRAFDAPMAGRVHSLFEHTANVSFGADARLLTLVAPGLPRLPDSVEWRREEIARLHIGDSADLTGDRLRVGECTAALERNAWDGSIPVYAQAPDKRAFLTLTGTLQSGFDRLPPDVRKEAELAVCDGNAQLIGLGIGLTPSFDDACVAAMALRRGLGKVYAFANLDMSRTTDVSARYLRLAAEGHFGETLCDVIAALFGQGALEPAIKALAGFGATSGCDMLQGIRWALENV